MKVTVDTNVLIRSVVQDDKQQARVADKVMREASVIAVTLSCLCEFVWVLRKLYGLTRGDIEAALRALLQMGNISVDRPAVEAGIAVLASGGDFADGVIAHEGRWLGGETFVSFDRSAVSLLSAQGEPARVLA